MVRRVYGDAVEVSGRTRLVSIFVAIMLVVFGAVTTVQRLRGSDACGKPFAEPLDPRSSVHLLPATPEPPYRSDPPTSGAHQPGNHPTGFLADEIPRPVQVSLLEAGGVLIQWRARQPSNLAFFSTLTQQNSLVTVAPRRDLPSPIVATAWQWKMTCERVDKTAIRAFIAAHARKAAAH
jgi:hypothetical protein